MIPHVPPSFRTGLDKDNNSPTFVLARYERSRHEGSPAMMEEETP